MVDATPKRMYPVDRISNLPESIISGILSTLPTKYAVATSILSRSWRFRWTRITSFNFEPHKRRQFRGDDAALTLDFSDFVNMVLLNHCGDSINKFVLRSESPHFRSAHLNMWANIAIARNVRVLDLNTESIGMARGQGEFYLPFSLYTGGTLEVLKLTGPIRVKPPNVVFLPKLAEMELSVVIYESDESLPILISGCPLLESLRILRTGKSDKMMVCSISSPALQRLLIEFYGLYSRYEDVDMKLEIDAPALEYLDLIDHMSSYISIQPQLSSVSTVRLGVFCSYDNMAVEFLESFGNVKRLTIEENRTIHSSETRLSLSFEGWANFLYSFHLPWSSMMDVLDSCVKLEELEIWCFESNKDLVGRGPRSSLSSLRCLTLRNFNGSKEEMEMLKFFLDHGFVMETVTLSSYHPQISVEEAKKKRILNEVTKWSRASPTCKVSWHEFPGLESCFESVDE